MKIKKQSIDNLFGEIDVNILFKRIKKLYPQTKYFHPFDPSYNGLGANDTRLDGFKIENLLSGTVMTIKDKDVSDKKIHLNINVEIYRMGMMYIETFYTSDNWHDEYQGSETVIIKNDKDGKSVSTDAHMMNFYIKELMPIEEIGPLDDEHYNYGSTDKREVDKIIRDKYGIIMNRIGTSLMAKGMLTFSRSPHILLDEDKKISINQDKDEKVSDKFDIYKIKDKDDIYHTIDTEVFDKACQDVKKDFIRIVFISYQHSIAQTWFSEIVSKSKSILEAIDNTNEVYWQNLRVEIEGWQLSFLTFHSKFYRDLSFYFSQYLSSDGVFNKKLCDEWEKEFEEDRKEAGLLYNEVKYALNNLATPGHTHDEQLLQRETEKVNERILLLSFLAMSIPMIGALLTPAFSLNLKLISGVVVLSLPLVYIGTRKIAFRRSKNLNTKVFLKAEAKDLAEHLDKIEDRKKEVLDNKDYNDGIKETFSRLMDKMMESQSKKLDKMNKKIKSL